MKVIPSLNNVCVPALSFETKILRIEKLLVLTYTVGIMVSLLGKLTSPNAQC